MLTCYAATGTKLSVLDRDPAAPLPEAAIWIDLLTPTIAEDMSAETLVRVDVPTREETQEIEFSSRVYVDEGALYLTVSALSRADADVPVLSPFTFVLTPGHLVTVRYEDPKALQQYIQRATRNGGHSGDALDIFLGLIDAFIDRLADVLEHVGEDIDRLNGEVFHRRADIRRRSRRLEVLIAEIGRQGDLVSKVRESLVSFERLAIFAGSALDPARSKAAQARLKLLGRDIRSLADHVHFLSGKITFLLDATLGLISVEQNNVMKIMSVVATVFMPPTLIASIFGMNFEWMPELEWPWGYPVALIAMVMVGTLPYLWFKRKGWL